MNNPFGFNPSLRLVKPAKGTTEPMTKISAFFPATEVTVLDWMGLTFADRQAKAETLFESRRTNLENARAVRRTMDGYALAFNAATRALG